MKKMFIGGEWAAFARSGKNRTILNPATEAAIEEVPESGSEDVDAAVRAARMAFDSGPWRKVSAQERGKILLAIARKIRAEATALAELEVQNCGKPLAEAQFDIQDAANCFEFYGGLATKIHGETMSVPAESLSFVLREPIGVCGQIIPWNFPILMAAWKLAPALAAGNTCVLKPSELTPLTALELARILQEEGIPDGVVNVVTGSGPDCGEFIAAHSGIDKIAFTGGTTTGQKVMVAAAGGIKKVSLELGGKNPNIIFEDCDLAAAVDGALFGAFANQGQVCSAGSRVLVQKSLHDAFMEKLLEKMDRIRLGNGLNPDTKMGPLISAAHRDRVENYIRVGVEEGARLVSGGKRPRHLDKGFFLEPTVFDRVDTKMRIAREEIFGPVMSVITFENEEEAIRIANDTEYGLAAGVWTQNIHRSLRVVKEIRAGIVWVNTYHPTYTELPWGGYKKSGIGRELGLYGIEEYLETKQVNLQIDATPIGWY